jgi:hypothetical protein
MPQGRVSIEPDPIAAVSGALRDQGRACVAGSIYLVGEVRGLLVR